MAMDQTSIATDGMGLPGLTMLGIGVFLQVVPPGFLPHNVIEWLKAVSFLAATCYYVYSIYKKSKEK